MPSLRLPLAGWLWIALGVSAAGFSRGESPPALIGHMQADAIDEASGIAPSSLGDDLYWTHNDSNGQPVLYAIDGKGRLKGQVRLSGVKNVDWEDLSSFVLDGKAYLLVADVGDNNGRRRDCSVWVVEEPAPTSLEPGKELSVPVAWSVPVRYPVKPIDCESVGVDVAERTLYFLTKRERPSVLYRFPLRPTAEEAALPLIRSGTVGSLLQPSGAQGTLPIPRGRYAGQPTALDFSPDGKHAVVLSYTHVAVYHRREGETWSVALGRNPEDITLHELVQGEAACFSRDGKTVIVTGEGVGAPLFSWAWSEGD